MPKGFSHTLDEIFSKSIKSGLSKEIFKEWYITEGLSRNAIAEKINYKVGEKVISAQRVNKLMKHIGLEEREEKPSILEKNAKIKESLTNKDPNLKKYGRNKEYSQKDIISIYRTGLSLQAIYNETGVSPQVTSRVLKENNIAIRRQVNYSKVVEDLAKIDVGEKEIRSKYVNDNLSMNEFTDWLSEAVGYTVGVKTVKSLLNHFNIRKSPQDIKSLQGRKSRIEKEYSFKQLKKAGYDNLEDLAAYYENNLSLTYDVLVNNLNDKLDKPYFTVRWLDRHMRPLLSEKRFRGVSRIEKNFGEWLSTVYDSEIITSCRNLIAPKEVDFFLPEINTAIEFNGDFWHSDKFTLKNHGLTSEEYHTSKAKECAEKGVQLLFVWESDWTDSQDKVIEALELFLRKKIILPILVKG